MAIKRSLFVMASVFIMVAPTYGQNQTDTFTPVTRWDRNYKIQLKKHTMAQAPVPGLQSFASGQVGDQWVVLAGKTGGMHSFTTGNTSAWVIDPVTKQAWGRELDDPSSGLSQHTINSLSSSNPQSYQRDNTLFISGGYVYETDVDNFTTYNNLTAVDLPELIDWVKSSGTQMNSNTILQTAGTMGDGSNYEGGLFQVTGGGMFEIDGQTQLVFGQMFEGAYDRGGGYQKYTSQIRTFDIDYDHAAGTLSYSDTQINPAGGDPSQFRRRDLNTFPILSKGDGGSDLLSAVALSGVFTEDDGIWTVPVEISPDGIPTMKDPNTDPSVFKQGMNGYECAKLGMYSSSSGEMIEILFGGITANEFVDDPANGNLRYESTFPFTNQISAVALDADGEYSQFYLGDYPDVMTSEDLPWLFGSNAEFFASSQLDLLAGDIIDLDSLTQRTTLGYIYGGIAAGTPNGGFGGDSIASPHVFRVEFVLIPEPTTAVIWTLLAGIAMNVRRRR